MKTRKQMKHAVPRKKMWKSKKSWVVGTVAVMGLSLAVPAVIGAESAKADMLVPVEEGCPRERLERLAEIHADFAEFLRQMDPEDFLGAAGASEAEIIQVLINRGIVDPGNTEDVRAAERIVELFHEVFDRLEGVLRYEIMQFIGEDANVGFQQGQDIVRLSVDALVNDMIRAVIFDENLPFELVFVQGGGAVPFSPGRNLFEDNFDNLRGRALAFVQRELGRLAEEANGEAERLVDRLAPEAPVQDQAPAQVEFQDPVQVEAQAPVQVQASDPASQSKSRKLPKTGGNSESDKKELPATGEETNAVASALGVLLATVGGMGVAASAFRRRRNG